MRGTFRRLGSSIIVLASFSSAASELMAQAEAPPMAAMHMAFTPTRSGTAADTARARDVVERLRFAIAPYQTLEAAEAMGYRSRIAPDMVKGARLLHLGKRAGVRRAGKPFDPAAPQALLYRRDANGEFRLAGAMYVAPPSATLDDLDAMIPLSVARWHRHLNVCVSGNRKSFKRIPGAMTGEACQAAGGRFRAESSYMVHVITDAGNDLTLVFPQGRDDGREIEVAH
jgi:hypothetical protein